MASHDRMSCDTNVNDAPMELYRLHDLDPCVGRTWPVDFLTELSPARHSASKWQNDITWKHPAGQILPGRSRSPTWRRSGSRKSAKLADPPSCRSPWARGRRRAPGVSPSPTAAPQSSTCPPPSSSSRPASSAALHTRTKNISPDYLDISQVATKLRQNFGSQWSASKTVRQINRHIRTRNTNCEPQ